MAADPLTKNTVSDLLNYDVMDDDDPFKDIEKTFQLRDDKTTLSPRAAKRKAGHDKGFDLLGLDEEVKIKKKRKPIAKLDETRLLSQAGIPKLRALARSGQITRKLHLKGKGHEFSDVAKLLNYYQLWLDNLYPRAKFADGLHLIEKAGHSKRMQTMRKEWIDEGKPGYARGKHIADTDVLQSLSDDKADAARTTEVERLGGDGVTAGTHSTEQFIFGNGANSEDMFFPDTNKKSGDDDDDGDAMPEEDDLDALLAEQHIFEASLPKSAELEPELEGEDDLDALLAEQEMKSRGPKRKTSQGRVPNEDDDLDALLAEHDASRRGTEAAKALGEGVNGEDDLDVRLAERASKGVEVPAANVPSSSPFPAIDDERDSELI